MTPATYRRNLIWPTIVFALLINLIGDLGDPSYIVVLGLTGVALVVVSLVWCSMAIEINNERIVEHSWPKTTLFRNTVTSCHFRRIALLGPRNIRTNVFLLSDDEGHSIAISRRGFGRRQRSQLFSQLYEWLLTSSADMDPATADLLRSLSRS